MRSVIIKSSILSVITVNVLLLGVASPFKLSTLNLHFHFVEESDIFEQVLAIKTITKRGLIYKTSLFSIMDKCQLTR
jgi:hypothetical protein